MRKNLKTLAIVSALVAGLLGAQALVADEDSKGMMGGGSMMSQGGGMKGMMAQMSQMMDTCNKMMQEHRDESQKPAAADKDKTQ